MEITNRPIYIDIVFKSSTEHTIFYDLVHAVCPYVLSSGIYFLFTVIQLIFAALNTSGSEMNALC